MSATITQTPHLLKVFNIIKDILCSNPVMAHPDFNKDFYIHVDASSVGLGTILTQLDEKGNHCVIEYASKLLNPAQSKYTNSVREGLGVLWSLNIFRYYVFGRCPTVCCDCAAISAVFGKSSTKQPDNLMLREWAARIMPLESVSTFRSL